MKNKIIKLIVIICSVLVCIFLANSDVKNNYELLWLLPLTFCLCAPKLLNITFNTKKTLFFYGFVIVSALRYVAGPLLMVLSGEYVGEMVKTTVSAQDIKISIVLMVYELIVCTVFLVLFPFDKQSKKEIDSPETDIALPQRTGIYMMFFMVTLVAVVLFPNSLSFFSFGTFGMREIELSDMSFFEQATIMLLICSKLLVFTTILSAIKKRERLYKANIILDVLGLAVTLFFGLIYYGGNRAQFIFSFVCSIYIYTLIFPKNKKIIYACSAIIIIPVIIFMTQQRNYFDYYSSYSGGKNYLLNLSQTVTAYFGGQGNVAVSVKMASQYSGFNTISQFFKDLTVPLVGINKILPLGDGRITNSFFNMTFFKTIEGTSQILPSIGHGYFFFGLLGAPIIDVIQLIIVRNLYALQQKNNRIEMIYLFNIVILRFSLMFGQNISQQMNGLSMQLMLPAIVYYFNNKITVRSNDLI